MKVRILHTNQFRQSKMLVVHSTPLILGIKMWRSWTTVKFVAVVSVDISYFGIVEPWRYEWSLEKSHQFFAIKDIFIRSSNLTDSIIAIFFKKSNFWRLFFIKKIKSKKINSELNFQITVSNLKNTKKATCFDFFDFDYIFTVEILYTNWIILIQ